jgi:hypothetical protein
LASLKLKGLHQGLFYLAASATDLQMLKCHHHIEVEANTLLNPEAFDLIRKTMMSLMQGSMDADLLNREAGFGERGSDFLF